MNLFERYRRNKSGLYFSDYNEGLNIARAHFDEGRLDEAFDTYEYLAETFPQLSVEFLAEAYDKYLLLRDRDRYTIYQSRILDFKIGKGEKVLDVGSGHKPFPFATHLSDIALEDDAYGRAGVPFKHIDNKPVYEFNVEKIPFSDNEFDFIYLSHIMEHVESPEKACAEVMRVAKRGYIETPTRAKDLWLNTALASNHQWYVEDINGVLVFHEYDEKQLQGIKNDLLMSMHLSPQSHREKAFSAMIYLKPWFFNTMFVWDDKFEFRVIRKNEPLKIFVPETQTVEKRSETEEKTEIKVSAPIRKDQDKIKFLQIHTFYDRYLDEFYTRNPEVAGLSFDDQTEELIRDGFSGIHMFAPYMRDHGYDSRLLIANNIRLQQKWIEESGAQFSGSPRLWDIVVKQVEYYKPDVLYLSDPITFDTKFLNALSYRPSLVIGWRAADIPEQTDWSGFDIILSGLAGIREAALRMGAKQAISFVPGFPEWTLDYLQDQLPMYDLVFAGSWTTDQHEKRNAYLNHMAQLSLSGEGGFSASYYLSGEIAPGNYASNINLGPRFGIGMMRALKTGKMIFDARGNIRNFPSSLKGVSQIEDLARNETMNMRIFEATGAGCLLIAEHYDNLEQYFEPGREIITFKTPEELIDKIRYFKANPAELEEIARRGQERCLRDYSMSKRSEEFHKIIEKNLNAGETYKTVVSTDQTKTDSGPIEKMIQQARDAMDIGNLDESFNILNKAKAGRIKVKNLDLTRAEYYVRKGSYEEAQQALLEELALFPDNEKAKEVLGKFNQAVINIPGEEEFTELLNIIRPYTMCGTERLYSLYKLSREVCEKDIPGNFVECGVARGGSSALIAFVIKKYSKRERKLFSFDTFEGMPDPGEKDRHQGIPADDTGWGTGTCAATEESLKEIAMKTGVSDVIIPVKGLFQDTLPVKKNEIGQIAFLHMDGDWYESTRAILNNLYDSLAEGSSVQVDDYGHWEGCKKAVDEFENGRSLDIEKNIIDQTGVWFYKPPATGGFLSKADEEPEDLLEKTYLNLGCGDKIHEHWTNVDFHARVPGVVTHDLGKGIPYDNGYADVIYHSHLLEHFSKSEAPKFLNECFRVLKPGGILRVAVPDLETITREYLINLEGALNGDAESAKKYEWIMLELYDQTVRNHSGGEMLKYWLQDPMPVEDYVVERLGMEAMKFISALRDNPGMKEAVISQLEKAGDSPEEIGAFRKGGEIHQWMYDRYSMQKLLEKAGFREIRVVEANESVIPGFNRYLLDIEADGSIRKPDSLFMEAVK